MTLFRVDVISGPMTDRTPTTMLRRYAKGCRAADLMMVGAASVSIDQRLGGIPAKLGREALDGDWANVGNDLRRAMGAIGRARYGIRAA